MKHQITLIGKDISSVYHGIKEFGPDVIHIIYTEEIEDFVEQMLPMLPKSISRTMHIVDPYDAAGVMAVCREIHRNNQGEFAYNVSEGTKVMAFAANKVAEEMNADVFYLTQQGEIIHLRDFSKSLIRSSLSNEEIIRLSGNKVIAYDDAKTLLEENITMSRQIKQFIEKYKQEHSRLQKYYSVYCNRKIELLPASYEFSDKLSFKHSNGRLQIMRGMKTLLKLNGKDGCFLYFEGRWWETLVAEQTSIWSSKQPNPPQTWQSVVFQLTENGEKGIKNEVDVLLNSNQELIFIECKSGNVTQNDIYKIDAVRETYGGDISHAVLASYYPLDNDIIEKCEDLQINIFAPHRFADRIDFIYTLPQWLAKMNEQLVL